MTRIAVVATVLFAALTSAGCDVGTVLANSSGDGGGSGSGSGSGSDIGVDCPAPQATPNPAHTHAASGTSNAGMACVASGCHLQGSTGAGAPVFNYAGTVYNSTGTAPAPGINVLITVGGATKKWMTDADGNFYVADPLQAAPTATAQATTKVCQTPTAMTGLLGAGNGNCNAGGTCHGTGGTEGKITSSM